MSIFINLLSNTLIARPFQKKKKTPRKVATNLKETIIDLITKLDNGTEGNMQL